MTPEEAVVVRQLLDLVVERVHGPGVDDIVRHAEKVCAEGGGPGPDNPPWNDRWTVGDLHVGFDTDGLHLWSGTRSIVVPTEDVDNVLTAIRAARAVGV